MLSERNFNGTFFPFVLIYALLAGVRNWYYLTLSAQAFVIEIILRLRLVLNTTREHQRSVLVLDMGYSTPREQRLWVQILLGAALFSLSEVSRYSFFHIVRWLAVQQTCSICKELIKKRNLNCALYTQNQFMC